MENNKKQQNVNGRNETENENRIRHDADSGNDGSSNALLQQEELIDPGNEHRHDSITHSSHGNSGNSKYDADAGGDGTGTAGPKPE